MESLYFPAQNKDIVQLHKKGRSYRVYGRETTFRMTSCRCEFHQHLLRLELEERFPEEDGFVVHNIYGGTFRRPRCLTCSTLIHEVDLAGLFPEREEQIDDLRDFNKRRK